METTELLSTLTTKTRELTPREREFLFTVFLEELSIDEVPLNTEVRRRLETILHALRSVPPLEGISWVMEQLRTTHKEASILEEQGIAEFSFEDEG